MNFMMLYIPKKTPKLDGLGLCAEELRLASTVSDWEFRERYPEERYQSHPVMPINYNK